MRVGEDLAGDDPIYSLRSGDARKAMKSNRLLDAVLSGIKVDRSSEYVMPNV